MSSSRSAPAVDLSPGPRAAVDPTGDPLLEIASRYDRPGPRYTSYPPANRFHDEIGPLHARSALESLGPRRRLALYVHVPFCEARCTYCGCFVVPTRKRSAASSYLDSLRTEIRSVAEALPDDVRVETVHVGGGTPTYLQPEEIESLFADLERELRVSTASEISFEIDPRVTTDEHFAALRRVGAGRVSLGVQDANDSVQEAIGRHQSWEQTETSFHAARAHGFDSINIDLVYGLPRQTLQTFEETLRRIVSLAPERLAVFGYAHIPWLRSQQRSIDERELPGTNERILLAGVAHRALAGAGYSHIGLDHYALPDDELVLARARGGLARNFMGYTPHGGLAIVGLGVSAIGEVDGSYFQNQKKLSRYATSVAEGDLPIERGWLPSTDDRVRGWVIQSLLCQLRLEEAEFEVRFDVPFARYFANEIPALAPLVDDGLIERRSGVIVVTETGRRFLRNIAMVFDAYLARSGAQGYSRTV